MTNAELAKTLVDLIGGKENVTKASNCMTRLRVEVKERDRVKDNEIKSTEGVLGYITEGNSLQIVLGPGKAKKVTDICTEELGLPKVMISSADWKEN